MHVVNNNAAALVLAATALACGREIIISRGEMVEIGDGFRLPDLLVSTGARLREVGTTNRTTAADYAAAAGPDTGFILKVHPSNFRILGFTRRGRGRRARRPRTSRWSCATSAPGLLAPHPVLPAEPDAATALAGGAALVTASGDKLLGGPAGGAAAGRRGDLVAAPAAAPAGPRAAGGQADPGRAGGDAARQATPTAAALHEPVERLRDRAGRLARPGWPPTAWMPGRPGATRWWAAVARPASGCPARR